MCTSRSPLSGAAVLVLVGVAGSAITGPGQSSAVVLALPLLGVGMLAGASLGLVVIAARALGTQPRPSVLASPAGSWSVTPAQFARLCLLVTLAVTIGVFASTYTSSDRASAIDRADYLVGRRHARHLLLRRRRHRS